MNIHEFNGPFSLVFFQTCFIISVLDKNPNEEKLNTINAAANFSWFSFCQKNVQSNRRFNGLKVISFCHCSHTGKTNIKDGLPEFTAGDH